MELQALLSLTLHHCCCFDQTGSEGEERSTPRDAYNASCNTLTGGIFFASRVAREGEALLARSWKSSAVGSGSEGVD